MYAVIKTGGKQHKVAEGEILKVEKLKASEGEPVDITDVLLIEKDGEVTLGSPFIEGAKVTAKILRHGKEDKVTIIKMKRRKDYRKKQGHCLLYTSPSPRDRVLSRMPSSA